MKLCISLQAFMLFLVTFSSCNNTESSKEVALISDDTVPAPTKENNPAYNRHNIPSYKIYPITTGDSFTVKREIDSILVQDTIHVKIEKPGRLTGIIISPSEKSNLRFNQVIDLNGKTEGPFGKDFRFDIHQSGNIMIIVGSSQMAEHAYSGAYSVLLKLQK